MTDARKTKEKKAATGGLATVVFSEARAVFLRPTPSIVYPYDSKGLVYVAVGEPVITLETSACERSNELFVRVITSAGMGWLPQCFLS